jgi:MFS family permease
LVDKTADRPTFGDVLASREFRAMWLAELASSIGDQFTRIALAFLVFERTGSAALTGIVYAMTFIATVIGALTLSGVADRYSRRSMMIAMDAGRAVLVAAMAIPGNSLPMLCALVVTISLIGGAYKGAQLALLRDVLSERTYPTGMAMRQLTNQLAQIMGVVMGGFLFLLGPQIGIGIDAATFAVSALVLQKFVRNRPARRPDKHLFALRNGLEVMAGDPRLRAMLLMTLLGFFFVAAEGVAAPYAVELGHYGPVVVGLLLASGDIGATFGLPFFLYLTRSGRRVLALPLSGVLAGIPLILVLAPGGLYVSIFLLAISGAFWSIQVMLVVTSLAELLPAARRAQGMGIASAVNLTAQGLGVAMAGAIAQKGSPTWAIALAGMASLPIALWSTRSYRRLMGSSRWTQQRKQ